MPYLEPFFDDQDEPKAIKELRSRLSTLPEAIASRFCALVL